MHTVARCPFLTPETLFCTAPTGQIEVHDPYKLETEVLHRYFRHNKFASFQRQLNYFGFRKIAGKGRMAPCSYVNEAVKGDINNLIHIKRKTPATQTTEPAQRDRASARIAQKYGTRSSTGSLTSRPRLPTEDNDDDDEENEYSSRPYSSRSSSLRRAAPTQSKDIDLRPTQVPRISSYQSTGAELQAARSAVGRGIRHSFRGSTTAVASSGGLMRRSNSLVQLEQNYQNALLDAPQSQLPPIDSMDAGPLDWSGMDPTPIGDLDDALCRSNSLVDLALLAGDDGGGDMTGGFDFVDFPYDDLRPNTST